MIEDKATEHSGQDTGRAIISKSSNRKREFHDLDVTTHRYSMILLSNDVSVKYM